MKKLAFCTIISVVLAMGCSPRQDDLSAKKGRLNEALINSFRDMGVRQGIIAQSTLYPYHFVDNSDQLNQLGKRDLTVLAEHFRNNPGSLNIGQGDVSEELYSRRVDFVNNFIDEMGIETGRISISDDFPKGPGISSNRMVHILEKTRETQIELQPTGTKALPQGGY